MKETILKAIEDLKLQKSKVARGKHASPQDMIKLLGKIDIQIERHQLKLKKLEEK